MRLKRGNRMKKILFIVSTLEKGGMINVVYDLVRNIDKSIFNVFVLTLSPEPENTRLSDFEKIQNVKIHSLNLSRISGIFSGVMRVQRIIDEINPKIIHSHGIRADGFLSKAKTNALKVATIHSFIEEDYSLNYGKLKGRIMSVMDISYLKKMSICVGVSQSVADYVKQKFGIKNAIGIPNGVDIKRFFPINDVEKIKTKERLSLPLDKKIFLSTGLLIDRKDPLFLIRQWILASRFMSECHLYILGVGELYDKCLELAKKHENIHILGRKDNVQEYLQAGDYYVSASKSEGISLSILEAMACGLPLLLTDIPPFREVLSHGDNLGLCYKLGDGTDFIEKLQKLLKFDLGILKKEAILTLQKEFSVEKMVKRYQDIYND
jgi:glycosyltransferase involved in cell wall biosynthesis